jgi:hypothetical protein
VEGRVVTAKRPQSCWSRGVVFSSCTTEQYRAERERREGMNEKNSDVNSELLEKE